MRVSHPGGPPAVGRFAGEIDYVNSFGHLMVSDRGDLNGAYSSFGLSTIEVSSLGIVKFPGLPFVTLAPGGVVEIDLRLTASSGARKDSEGSLAPSARWRRR